VAANLTGGRSVNTNRWQPGHRSRLSRFSFGASPDKIERQVASQVVR